MELAIVLILFVLGGVVLLVIGLRGSREPVSIEDRLRL